VLRANLLRDVPVSVAIERAAAADLPAVLALLTSSRLPVDGLADHADTILVARDDGRIVGCVALEVYEDGALLRSLAVDAARRGIGGLLVQSALGMAERLSSPGIYLLTTTAEAYFPAFGFAQTDRAAVPPGVHASVEFQGACPSTAVVMRRLASTIRE
jgi:amino-acid N-acetyltransferase